MIGPFPLAILILLTRFSLYQPDVDSVSVVGSWNAWKPQTMALREDSAWVWEHMLDLEPGTYEYRFLVNGALWIKDPDNPAYGGAHSNSIIRIRSPNHPTLRPNTPRPGTVVKEQPFRIFIHYVPGQDAAMPDSSASKLSAGSRTFQMGVTSRDNTFLQCILDSLPEGEIDLTINSSSSSGYTTDPLRFKILINSKNQRPKARTEHIVFAMPGWPLDIDGGGSYDPDGEPLMEYRWNVLNNGGIALLENQDTPYPKFVPPYGITRLTYSVSDGELWSNPDTLSVLCFGPEARPLRFVLEPDSLPEEIMPIVSVSVAGTWNGWRSDRDTLSLLPDGSWETWLMPGSGLHEHKFVVNDTLWITDYSRTSGDSDSRIQVSRPGQYLPKVELGSSDSGEPSVMVEPNCPVPFLLFDARNETTLLVVQPGETIAIPFSSSAAVKTVGFPQDDQTAYSATSILAGEGIDGDNHGTILNEPPAWAEDAIICCLRQQSFRELAAGLSLLAEAGFTALWIPPIYEGPTAHGYGPTDMFSIRKSLGTKEEFADLVEEAHSLGFRIFLDFVANHTSDQHPRFLSAWNDESIWHSWYQWDGDGMPSYWFHWDQLINLNLWNPSVRHHLLASAAYWQEFGLDGLRLDVAWALPRPFIRHLKEDTRIRDSEFLLLGEVIPRDPQLHGLCLDVSYDTDFYGMILDLLSGRRSSEEVPTFQRNTASRYPDRALGMTYLENPDTPFLRSLFEKEEAEAAALILFTWPGIPMMIDPYACDSDSVISPELLLGLISFRKEFESLRGQTIEWIHGGEGILAYGRPGNPPCLVIVNLSHRQRDVDLDVSSVLYNRNILWKSALHVGTPPAFRQRGQRLHVECPEWSGVILVPDEEN